MEMQTNWENKNPGASPEEKLAKLSEFMETIASLEDPSASAEED